MKLTNATAMDRLEWRYWFDDERSTFAAFRCWRPKIRANNQEQESCQYKMAV